MKEARMLYKAGGVEKMHGGLFTTIIIDEAEKGALDKALKDGWAMTTDEALANNKKKPLKKQVDSLNNEDLEDKDPNQSLILE